MDIYLPLIVVTLTLTGQCQGQIQFTIFEERPVGTHVGNIATAGKFNETRTLEEFNALVFSFLEQNQYQDYFKLGETTGILSVKKRIDRDAICSLECSLNFDVAVRSSMSQEIFFPTITVVLEDINDNMPVFQHASWKLEIPENAAPNSAYDIIPAKDNDTSLQYSIQQYSLTPTTSNFSLNVSKKLDGNFLVQLIVKQALDRELQSLYQVYITAVDGGAQPNTGNMLVNISVTDVNDNLPIFNQSVYTINVTEDTQPNTSVFKVTATDRDAGENGRVSYRIITTADTNIHDLFRIDGGSGNIYILTQITYKPDEIYSMIVEATDHGDGQKEAQARINIIVEDSGNNPPVVRISILSGSGNVVSMQESANVGAFVAHVSVDDSDVGENGRVDCVVSSLFFRTESILPGKRFKILLNENLDREEVDMHNVTLTCHDFGQPVMNASANFTVLVTDDNDNDPNFTRNSYNATLSEKNNVGFRIVQVSAVDRDIGMNSEIHYSLHSDAGSNFAINVSSGVITAMKSFDREQNMDFTFQVLAVDRGDPPRTGTASVYVNVDDVNDNKPVFNRTTFTFDIWENEDIGSFVGRVGAVDADRGDNARIIYYMLTQKEQPFQVLPSGEIQTKAQLDRELKSQYNFVVYAEDQGKHPLNSSAYVTVYVQDINDNDPIIVYPNKTNHTIWSKSGTSLPLTTIQAHDIDEGINKQLAYYIYEGNSDDMFLLHPELGELFLNRNYRITKDKSVNLVICVNDSGKPVRTRCAQLTVVITVNNTTTPATHAPSTNYITISIVVIIVTVLVSTAIILTIFFLRKIDRNRQNQKFGANGPLGVPMPNSYSSSPASSQHDITSDAEFMERKKKDVSFSPSTSFKDVADKGNTQYPIATDTQSGAYLYDSVPVAETSHKALEQSTQLNVLHLQQLLYKTYHQEARAPPRIPHPTDNNSDTSGETIPSDSGRGDSEHDVPSTNQTGDDSRSFDCGSYNSHFGTFHCPPNVPPRKQVTQGKLQNRAKSSGPSQTFTGPSRTYSTSTEYLNERKPVSSPSSRRQRGAPYVRCAPSHSSFTSSHMPSYMDNNSKSLNFNTWNYLQPSNALNYTSVSKDRDFFHQRQESISTCRSRDDDDDAATTTSGSYTINPEELEEDFYLPPQDMVV